MCARRSSRVDSASQRDSHTQSEWLAYANNCSESASQSVAAAKATGRPLGLHLPPRAPLARDWPAGSCELPVSSPASSSLHHTDIIKDFELCAEAFVTPTRSSQAHSDGCRQRRQPVRAMRCDSLTAVAAQHPVSLRGLRLCRPASMGAARFGDRKSQPQRRAPVGRFRVSCRVRDSTTCGESTRNVAGMRNLRDTRTRKVGQLARGPTRRGRPAAM